MCPISPASVSPALPKPSFPARVAGAAVHEFQSALVKSPRLDAAVDDLSGPFVKRMFNQPAKPGAPTGPAPLRPETIEQARALMAAHFRPGSGKAVVCIAGGGSETVHAFVVTGVKPDGSVQITQAIAQYADRPESYPGVGGWVSKQLDRMLGNQPRAMQGVVTDDWASYARRSERNSVVVMELDADPKKLASTLQALSQQVGKPYDKSMLAADPATPATQRAMYCTEVAAWFVNSLNPGAVKPSSKMGWQVYQVADLMRATDGRGGPLKVLYNGENRLDIAQADPRPHRAGG